MLKPPSDDLSTPALMIDGCWIKRASGGSVEHRYSATGEVTRSIPLAGVAEVGEAVQAAVRASTAWRKTGNRARGSILRKLAELIENDGENLARIQTLESGLPISYSRGLPTLAASYFEFNASMVETTNGEVSASDKGRLNYTVREPYGPVAAIVPWSVSLMSVSQVVAPILAAGNTVVLKPSPLAPFCAQRVGELAVQAGLPPGVMNVIAGDATAGQELAADPRIGKIHFTGSRQSAKTVLKAAAENITPVCLELGGKAPLIVFSDGDLLEAAKVAASGLAGLSGQGCAVPTRILVQQDVFPRFLTLLKGLTRRIKVGDPFEPATQMGPVVSEAACARLLETIRLAAERKEGTLACGGSRLDGEFSTGWFVAPTIFVDVDPSSSLFQDELFGPVLSLGTFTSAEDGLRMANNSSYGLTGYVFTANVNLAHRAAHSLEAGLVWINGTEGLDPAMTFGGFKQSGFGKLGSYEGVREFTKIKNVWLRYSGSSGGDFDENN